jgi:hypothetical protein
MTASNLRQRHEVKPLQYAQGIYRLLTTLHVGDQVPEECYILDTRDEDDCGLDLVLIDLSNSRQATLFDPQQWIARRVLAQPTKILALPPYLVGIDGAEPRGMLCDLVQQARAVAKEAQHRKPQLRKGGNTV